MKQLKLKWNDESEQQDNTIDTFVVNLLTIGELSPAGRFYDADVMARMIEQFKSQDVCSFGEIFNYTTDVSPTVNLRKVSHKVNRLWIEGNCLKAEIQILNTEAGNKLKQILESVYFCPRGMGSTKVGEKNQMVIDPETYQLITVDAFGPSDVVSVPCAYTSMGFDIVGSSPWPISGEKND